MTPKAKAILCGLAAFALWDLAHTNFPAKPGTWCKSSFLDICTERYDTIERRSPLTSSLRRCYATRRAPLPSWIDDCVSRCATPKVCC